MSIILSNVFDLDKTSLTVASSSFGISTFNEPSDFKMSRYFKSLITKLDKSLVFTTVSGSLSAMLSVVIAFAAVVSRFVTLPDNVERFSIVATFNVLFSSSFNKPLRTKIFFTSVSLVPSCPANLAFAESLFAILSAIVSGSVSSLVA